MNDELATKCSDLAQWARKSDDSGTLYLRVCETAKEAAKYALHAAAEECENYEPTSFGESPAFVATMIRRRILALEGKP